MGSQGLYRAYLGVFFHVLLCRGKGDEHVGHGYRGETLIILPQALRLGVQVTRPIQRFQPYLAGSNKHFGAYGYGVRVFVRVRTSATPPIS